MITRGIVEKILTPYLVKVRIPTLNRTKDSSIKTLSDELNDTPICTLNHYDPNLRVGDIVIVGFEDNDISDYLNDGAGNAVKYACMNEAITSVRKERKLSPSWLVIILR